MCACLSVCLPTHLFLSLQFFGSLFLRWIICSDAVEIHPVILLSFVCTKVRQWNNIYDFHSAAKDIITKFCIHSSRMKLICT